MWVCFSLTELKGGSLVRTEYESQGWMKRGSRWFEEKVQWEARETWLEESFKNNRREEKVSVKFEGESKQYFFYFCSFRWFLSKEFIIIIIAWLRVAWLVMANVLVLRFCKRRVLSHWRRKVSFVFACEMWLLISLYYYCYRCRFNLCFLNKTDVMLMIIIGSDLQMLLLLFRERLDDLMMKSRNAGKEPLLPSLSLYQSDCRPQRFGERIVQQEVILTARRRRSTWITRHQTMNETRTRRSTRTWRQALRQTSNIEGLFASWIESDCDTSHMKKETSRHAISYSLLYLHQYDWFGTNSWEEVVSFVLMSKCGDYFYRWHNRRILMTCRTTREREREKETITTITSCMHANWQEVAQHRQTSRHRKRRLQHKNKKRLQQTRHTDKSHSND